MNPPSPPLRNGGDGGRTFPCTPDGREAAEHLVAVQLAARNRMEFAMAVTYGSSLQVALFVAPLLVILGAGIGQPMDLVFTPLEVVAVGAAVGISALIALDGESNWLEGALLVIVYLILAGSFFELPG